ncbi:hypothetical protein [Sphingomonas sp. GB1N7]|uniref:hypothetical protein n=1 Tax=Parasphingomonas caseinilytica TaxID=3096158 RepID=UPI002FC61A84
MHRHFYQSPDITSFDIGTFAENLTLDVVGASGRTDLAVKIDAQPLLIDLAAIVFAQQPDIKLIVTSGAKTFADSELPDHGVFLSKPYTGRSLSQLVQQKLGPAC